MGNSIDLSNEAEMRDFRALKLMGVRREIMTYEGLATMDDPTAEQREKSTQ